jgi:hypothetical protein
MALVLVLATATSALVALHRGARGLGPPPLVRIATVALGVVAFEVLTALSIRAVDGAASVASAAHGVEMRACATKGVVMALALAVVMFASARRTAVTAPGASGAALGAAAGFAATLALHVACAASSHEHVMLSHVVPVVVAAALGVLLGRRVLSV